MIFQWSENLAVGNDLIDNQHKELFSRVDKLLSAMTEGRGRDEIGKLIVFLENYVVKHFRAEEELMLRHNYDGYDQQKEAHTRFIKDITFLKKEFEVNGVNLSLVIQTQKKVCDWLVNHISKSDKEIGTFLKAKGIIS